MVLNRVGTSELEESTEVQDPCQRRSLAWGAAHIQVPRVKAQAQASCLTLASPSKGKSDRTSGRPHLREPRGSIHR